MSAPGHPGLPVLSRYDADHLSEIALPLGGIGTGTISLGGRGDLRDWEIVNRPAKGFVPDTSFFAVSVGQGDGPRVTRALEGVLQPPYSGWMGAGFLKDGVPNASLPRFRECRFEAAYPFATVHLADPDVPVSARIEAFNPLIPGDADASGLPVAVLRVVLTNQTDQSLDATVAANLQNFIGTDGKHGTPVGGANEHRSGDGLKGVFCTTTALPASDPRSGSLVLATTAPDTSHRTSWGDAMFSDALLDWWDDLDEDGRLDERARGTGEGPVASVAAHLSLGAHETAAATFLIGWHFPNRVTWNPAGTGPAVDSTEAAGATSEGDGCCSGESCGPSTPGFVGNHYTTRFADAWDVVARVAVDLDDLEQRTRSFVEAFVRADLPDVVKDAALSTLTALRTQTSFRTADGRFYGFEGCSDDVGCCYGSCTHVWNYEPATAHLFGGLARSMREVEFAHATRADGHMSFRVNLPIDQAQGFGIAAADGQMGCLVKLYREWQLSGDDAFLTALWPSAKAALSFAWIEGGWDADRDGVMEGCQHNTMDVEYHGPNPQMQLWYLAALRAGEEMARHLGEPAFAAECRRIFDQGSAFCDEVLFNGEYYEHEIRPPASPDAIGAGLSGHTYDEARCADPPHQLGAGCLVDQLVGQEMAHLVGLGYLVDPSNVATTLQSIMRHNWRDDMFGHFNHFRSYAIGDESALLMASYPLGRRPRVPFPYYNEVMTGFEYTAAVGMIQEGLADAGLKIIQAVRDRHDGRRRNPFNEPECGHHYARAMASWGAVLALTGFSWSAVTGTMRFRRADSTTTWWWSTGDAHGTMRQEPEATSALVTLSVLGGSLPLRSIALEDLRSSDLTDDGPLTVGQSLTITVTAG